MDIHIWRVCSKTNNKKACVLKEVGQQTFAKDANYSRLNSEHN